MISTSLLNWYTISYAALTISWRLTNIKKKDAVKEQVLKIFKTRVSDDSRGMAPVGCFRIEGGHLQVACIDHWLNIYELQLAGKSAWKLQPSLNGMKDIAYYECQKAPNTDAGLQ